MNYWFSGIFENAARSCLPKPLALDGMIDARCEKLCLKSLLTLELCNTYAGFSLACLLFPAFAPNLLFPICQNRPADTNSEVDKSATPSVAQLAGKFKEQAASITGKEVRSACSHQQVVKWEMRHSPEAVRASVIRAWVHLDFESSQRICVLVQCKL